METPTVKDIKTVCKSKVIPSERGCDNRVNRNDNVRIIGIVRSVISENSLKKILVLGIKDKSIIFFSLKF